VAIGAKQLVQGVIVIGIFAGVLVYGLGTLRKGPPRCDHSGAVGFIKEHVKTESFYKGGAVTLANIRTTNSAPDFAACLADIMIVAPDRTIPYANVQYTIKAEPSGHWIITMPGW